MTDNKKKLINEIFVAANFVGNAKAFVNKVIDSLDLDEETSKLVNPKEVSIYNHQINMLKINVDGQIEQVLKDAYFPIYDETFTEEELQQIVDYVKSPLGQKASNFHGEATSKAELIINKWFEGLMRETFISE